MGACCLLAGKPQARTDFEDELVASLGTLAKHELLNEKLDMPERISFLTLLKRNTDALKQAKLSHKTVVKSAGIGGIITI